MNDDAMRGNRQPVVIAEITWDKLDLTKYYVLGVGMFTGVSVMLYPIAVVKTRLQVSQRMIVQGYSGHATYSGSLDLVRKIIKSDGIQGLYKGFGLSVMTYTPSSAMWWASYGASQHMIWRLLGHGTESSKIVPSESKLLLVQASWGGGVLQLLQLHAFQPHWML